MGAGLPARPVFWLDVFTDTPLAGNGLAVVLDADGLSAETMLAFARETGLSETTFVQTPTDEGAGAGADYRNRIWTVSDEIPFAGHPSLGTAVAVALSARGTSSVHASGGPIETVFHQETGAGVQEVTARFDGELWKASVHQPPATFGRTFAADRVAAALGLEQSQMDPELSCQIVSTGLPALLAPVADLDALAACAPDFEALRALDDGPSLNLYPFVHERGSRTIRARCFGADLAGVEDPATGSAAGPLVAYLQDCLDIDRIAVAQGVEMGRPSTIEAAMENGRARVSGAVTVLVSGEVHLPSGLTAGRRG
jgi:trans-2,3-dihydro-3-hydroxyanthranilate isomerase